MFVQAAKQAMKNTMRQGNSRHDRLRALKVLQLELDAYAELKVYVDTQIREILRRDNDVESLIMLEHAATKCLRSHTGLKSLLTTFIANLKPRIQFHSNK